MTAHVVQVLSELVAIPSVNPMGQAVTGPEYLEGRVTDYLEAFFRRLGLPFARQTVEPGRDNILARIDGAAAPERSARSCSGTRIRTRCPLPE